MPVKLHRENCAFLPTWLLSPEFAQMWVAFSSFTQKLCKSHGQPVQLPAKNVHFLPAVEHPLACAAQLTDSLRDRGKLTCMHELLLPRQHAKESLVSGIYV